MYRPKPQQQKQPEQPPAHRLVVQSGIPTEEDLKKFFQEAEQKKMPMEIPWGIEHGASYLLTIASSSGETVWSMYQGDIAEGNPLWRYPTRDAGLIHSLILQSVPEDVIAASSPAGKIPASSSGVITGNNQVPAAPMDSSKASLQGRLENMQISNLVQSIQMSKMSGRLQIYDEGAIAQLYFLDGAPVHATSMDGSGDLAVVEIMTWEHGEFRFFPAENTDERTVKRRLDALIMEGITLLDQDKFLENQGLKPESYLMRKEARITPEEFKAKVSHGAPLDLPAQMALYEMCDGRSRLKDLLTRRPMPRSEWVPLLFNLTSCGLIVISESTPFAGRAQGLASAELDHGMIAGVLRSLMRADTGMFTYPALLYLTEREFSKSIAFGMPLSLIIFETRIILNNQPPQPLPTAALKEIANRLELLKRPFDILAHHETFDFALLLPGANHKAARMIGHKVAESLINVPLIQGQTQRLLLAGGIASAPEDTQELGRFIAAARDAKNRAKEAKVPLKAFSET